MKTDEPKAVMSDMMPKGYTSIPDREVPDGLVYTTPRRYEGQTIVTRYSHGNSGDDANYDADYGDKYVQVTDRSIPATQYGRRAHRPEWYAKQVQR